MNQLTTADLVALDLSATTKDEATHALAERLATAGRVTDLDGFLADVAAREEQMPTGLEGGIGIPHCRSAHVTEPALAFGRAVTPVDFGASDGPADLIFLIAAPDGADSDHLTILSSLARNLMDPQFTSALRAAAEPAAAAALIRGDAPATENDGESAPDSELHYPREGGEPSDEGADDEETGGSGNAAGETPDQPGERGESGAREPFRIVAVTSCPTGIAHTYMAAESLERAAGEAGAEIVVETQGSAGFERLSPGAIAAADGVILAHDVEVREKERFAGKPTVDVGVKAAINRAGELVAEVRGKAERGEATSHTAGAPVDNGAEPSEGYGNRLRKWLMTGVRYLMQDTWRKCRSDPLWTRSLSYGQQSGRCRRQPSLLMTSGSWPTVWASTWASDAERERPYPCRGGASRRSWAMYAGSPKMGCPSACLRLWLGTRGVTPF